MVSSKEDILYTSKLFDYFTVRIYSFLANFLPNKLIKKLPTIILEVLALIKYEILNKSLNI